MRALLKYPPGCQITCLTACAIPGGLLWCVNGLSKGDYSLAGGVWAGPVLSIVALLFGYWRVSQIEPPSDD